ncbi:MAG: preprotein translocase subunit YajC [Sedimentisphaerales bacterium]|nr:preprotein translocase subunit YajC [Sedimentisphaerales bacterium]
MNQIWFLAQAEAGNETGDEGTVIRSSDVKETEQTTSTTTEGGNVAQGQKQQKAPMSPWMQLLPFILIFALMYMLMFRGPKKKEQERQKMIQALKKNDRVRTVGGILGTVVDVKDDEILLKVDESNNTKIRVIPNAIHKLASDDSN